MSVVESVFLDTTSSSRSSGTDCMAKLASSSSSRSLGSAMSALKRRRNVREMFIQLLDPHRRYGNGDVVAGSVMLKLRQVTKGNLLTLSLQGHVVVKSQSTGTNTVIPIFTPQAVQLVDASMSLEQGVHELPFEIEFPYKRIPSSLDFEKGYIRYQLEAHYTRSSVLKAKISARANLTFVETIDVGRLPPPKPMLRYLECRKHKERQATEAKFFLGQAGALAGDNISVKAVISHNKPVKSLRGCIVTLYRLSRFDNESSEAKSFRKDLAQTVSPLFIDPQSLSGAITTSLRIPSDTFPTIATAPLISFRYFIEIVLDLRGKLTGHDFSGKKFFTNTLGFAETDAIKRERGILNMQQEITIGTTCQKSPTVQSPIEPSGGLSSPPAVTPQLTLVTSHEIISSEQSLSDEKAVIRRAEELLLPSAPVAIVAVSAPTAPAIDEIEELSEDGLGREVDQRITSDADATRPTKHEEAREDELRARESAPDQSSIAQPSAPSEVHFEEEHELPIYIRSI